MSVVFPSDMRMIVGVGVRAHDRVIGSRCRTFILTGFRVRLLELNEAVHDIFSMERWHEA